MHLSIKDDPPVLHRAPSLLLLALLITSCASNPANGGRSFSLVSAKEERAIGESAATSILTTYGLYRPESNATKYVTDLCNRTFAVTEAAAEPLQCNFIDDGSFNAAATPGYMLINRGLLPFMNSEAELAAVLGHEAGHLTARHINQAATHAKVAGIAVAVLTGVVAAKSDNSAAATLAIGAGGLGASLGLSAYGRAHELEADSLGRRYMEKMGYNPRESVNMVRAMQMYDNYQKKQAMAFNNGAIAPTSMLDRLKSSHPATPARVDAAVAAVGEPDTTFLPASDTTGRARFMGAIQGLTFGPARRYGIARKSELVLTQQRTVIPLPAGVTNAYMGSGSHDNLGTWLIGHPQSGAYLTVTSVKMTAGRSPASLIQAMTPSFGREDVTRMPIGKGQGVTNGYTTTYKFFGSDKRYRILAVPASHPVDQMLLVTAIYPNAQVMAAEDSGLMAIVSQMTFLTEEQADKYKQLELFTFRAATGQTVAQQAAHLPVSALQEELFRALNNLPEGTDMLPGQFYKTVRDPNP